MSAERGAQPAPDGRLRCPWALSTPDYLDYHDTEWGRPLRGEDPASRDRALFERLSLEAFQSGLSWLTILRKRAAFRAAFDDFDPARVAAYDERDVARLMSDAGIVRNAAKVAATIHNAGRVAQLDGGFSELVWAHRPEPRPRPRTLDDVPSLTPESTALARTLKRHGFRFVGPTTAYALMQATGMVDDHLADCRRPDEPRRALTSPDEP